MVFKESGRTWGYLAWRREDNGCHYISENSHAEEGFLLLIKATACGSPMLHQALYKHAHLISTPI